MVSRFCCGQSIASDKLLSILQVCDDLSLEWLFYGHGSMIRDSRVTVNNYGKYAGADVAKENSLFIKNPCCLPVQDIVSDQRYFSLINEKDRIISEKDKLIVEKDATIQSLLAKLVDRQ